MSLEYRFAGALLGVVAAIASPCPGQAPPGSLRRLVDLESLPFLEPGVTCRQFASTDPSGRGDDHGHFLRVDGGRCVLAEMQGPGTIARIWSANAQGRLRVFLDGEAEPRIDCPFADLFTGEYPPFVEPIAVHRSGGFVSWFPIPYARSCRVEVDELDDPASLYYQVQYLTWPADTAVRTFTRELVPAERGALADVVRAWNAPGPAPGLRGDERSHTGRRTVPAGGTQELERFERPGTLLRLEIGPERRDPDTLRGLVLEVFYDGAAEPSVAAPVGDFFGVAFGETPYRSLALGWTEEKGGYCNFPMPWRKEMRIALVNTSPRAQVVRWLAVTRAGEPPERAALFHAEFRVTDGVGDELYEFARVEGPGKHVGVTQALQGVGDLWYLEGNERFFVDGETEPSIDGTGTEDFYNGGWYWNGGTVALPLCGLNVKEEWTTNRTTPYRIQVPDAVPFEAGLVARIEHGSSNQVRDAYYSSVALWYGARRAAVRRPEPEELRQPRLWVFRPAGFLAGADLDWRGPGRVVRARWEDVSPRHRGLDRPLYQGFPVSYVERDAPAVDARVVLLPQGDHERVFSAGFEAPHADRFALLLRFLGEPHAAAVTVRVDGVVLGPAELRSDEPAPHAPKSFGPIGLARGEHRLEIVLPPGAGRAGIDAVRVVAASPFVRTWRIAPPVPARRDGTVEDAVDVEKRFLDASFDPADAGWKAVEARGDGLDLNRQVSRESPVLGYLAFAVKSPDARTARVLLGSDDGVRVWVDGQLRWSHEIHRHLTADEDRFDVPLRAGWNRFLVKVKNDYGGYGVMVRIADRDGALRIAADARD